MTTYYDNFQMPSGYDVAYPTYTQYTPPVSRHSSSRIIIVLLIVLCCIVLLVITGVVLWEVYGNSAPSDTNNQQSTPPSAVEPTGGDSSPSSVEPPASGGSSVPAPIKIGLWEKRAAKNFEDSRSYCATYQSTMATRSQMQKAFDNKNGMEHTCSWGWVDETPPVAVLTNSVGSALCGSTTPQLLVRTTVDKSVPLTSVLCYGQVPPDANNYDTSI